MRYAEKTKEKPKPRFEANPKSENRTHKVKPKKGSEKMITKVHKKHVHALNTHRRWRGQANLISLLPDPKSSDHLIYDPSILEPAERTYLEDMYWKGEEDNHSSVSTDSEGEKSKSLSKTQSDGEAFVTASTSKSNFTLNTYSVNKPTIDWVIDSGATHHVTNNINYDKSEKAYKTYFYGLRK